MALQLLRKSASDFIPNTGSNISLDGDHLKCDDYLYSEQYLTWNMWGGLARRSSDGDFRVITNSNFGNLIKIKADLTADGIFTFEPGTKGSGWTKGICIDDENFIYVGHHINDGVIQRYAEDGTWIWNFIGSQTVDYGNGLFYYPTNEHIYVCSSNNYYVYEIDKDGNEIHAEYTYDHNSLFNPQSVWVDATGIYVACQGTIGIWDLSWNYIGYVDISDTDVLPLRIFWYGKTLRRKTNGNYLIYITSAYGISRFFELDSSGNILKVLALHGKTDFEKGNIWDDMSSDKFVLSLDEKTAWRADRYNRRIIAYNLKDASERLAICSHNFGSTVNIKRISIKARHDNRDSNLESLKFWYNIGAGDVQVSLLDGSMDVECSNIILKVGLQNYGFTKNWPQFFYVDIEYEDNKKDIGERTFEALEITKETEIIDISNELEVLEL